MVWCLSLLIIESSATLDALISLSFCSYIFSLCFFTPQDNDIDNSILSQPPCSVLIWFLTLCELRYWEHRLVRVYFLLCLLTYLQTGVGSKANMIRSTLRFCVCFKTNVTAAIQSIKLVSSVIVGKWTVVLEIVVLLLQHLVDKMSWSLVLTAINPCWGKRLVIRQDFTEVWI